jgi:hypothetical protein
MSEVTGVPTLHSSMSSHRHNYSEADASKMPKVAIDES